MGAAMKDFREFALRQVLKNESLLSREEGGGEMPRGGNSTSRRL